MVDGARHWETDVGYDSIVVAGVDEEYSRALDSEIRPVDFVVDRVDEELEREAGAVQKLADEMRKPALFAG